MTSNLGSHIIREHMGDINDTNHSNVVEQMHREVLSLLKQSMRPEFLNRIDEIVVFNPLNREEIRTIVQLQLEGIARQLKSNGIELRYTEEALALLATMGYSPEFGARALKRVLQREVLNELSKALLSGTIEQGRLITVKKTDDNRITFEN